MNFDRPHRRLNLLTGEWVLVSSHRTKRPWLGQVEKAQEEQQPAYDPTCYLCPRNKRSTGAINPDYPETFVFDNDFASLLPPERDGEPAQTGLLSAEPEVGVCRVVCFSPRHDLTLPEMSQLAVEAVLNTWTEQTLELGRRPEIRYVQVFENKGAMMGSSNPHPHSQIWATGHIPNEPAKELIHQEEYLREHGTCLLCDYVKVERLSGERIVAVNKHFTAMAPFWAIWPFEIMLISNRHLASLNDLSPAEITGLADIMRQVTIRYDNLFEISFPYSMGFHQAPFNKLPYPGHHFHAHYYPPLLRSATVRKFMVGFEMLGMPQRDITPEAAAARLREMSPLHYKTH
jgi:UDPglucose--hexose-1-phosphate uridylyltransferase